MLSSKGFRNPGARISESSVFMQNGTKISELPLIVKKVQDIFELYKWMDIKPASELQPTETEKDNFILVFPDKVSEEEREIISGFNRCFNSSSIFRLLKSLIHSHFKFKVSSHALRKIIEMENTY